MNAEALTEEHMNTNPNTNLNTDTVQDTLDTQPSRKSASQNRSEYWWDKDQEEDDDIPTGEQVQVRAKQFFPVPDTNGRAKKVDRESGARKLEPAAAPNGHATEPADTAQEASVENDPEPETSWTPQLNSFGRSSADEKP